MQLGLRTHVSSQGMFGYALLCASSWRNAYQTAFKYHQIDSPLMNISWIEEHDVAIAQVPAWQDFNLPQLSHERYVLVRDMQVATIFTTTLDVMGPWSRPLQILLNGPEPAHAPAIRQAFQCPVFFNQSRNELHYPRHWLDRAPRFSNPITAIQMSETCSRLLEEFRWKAGVTWRVHQLLTREPGKFPSLEAVADALFMTSRTLRRHLSQEGTSYSDLLNGIRRSLAIDYLTTTPLSTEDIAATLGFADSASFRHAFKRWTGKTPAGYR